MNLLYLTVPMAILLGAGFTFAFIWATKKGQFDDLDTPAQKILNDDFENTTMKKGNTTK